MWPPRAISTGSRPTPSITRENRAALALCHLCTSFPAAGECWLSLRWYPGKFALLLDSFDADVFHPRRQVAANEQLITATELHCGGPEIIKSAARKSDLGGKVTNLGIRSVGETILLRARTHLRLESLRWPEGSVQSKELDDGAEFLYDFLLSLAPPRPMAAPSPACGTKSDPAWGAGNQLRDRPDDPIARPHPPAPGIPALARGQRAGEGIGRCG
jgi:hypothetical protein